MAAARGSRSAWRRLGRCPGHADRKRQRAIGGIVPHRFPTRRVSVAGLAVAALRWREVSGASRRHPVLPAVHGPSFPAAAFCRCARAIRNRANRVRRHAQSHAICTRNHHVNRNRNSRRDFSHVHGCVRRASRAVARIGRRVTRRRRRKRPPDFSGGRPEFPPSRRGATAMVKQASTRRHAPPQRAASAGTGRCSGPSYQDSGRISRLSAPCSKTCAAQPVMRLATNSGVNSGISKPIR